MDYNINVKEAYNKYINHEKELKDLEK